MDTRLASVLVPEMPCLVSVAAQPVVHVQQNSVCFHRHRLRATEQRVLSPSSAQSNRTACAFTVIGSEQQNSVCFHRHRLRATEQRVLSRHRLRATEQRVLSPSSVKSNRTACAFTVIGSEQQNSVCFHRLRLRATEQRVLSPSSAQSNRTACAFTVIGSEQQNSVCFHRHRLRTTEAAGPPQTAWLGRPDHVWRMKLAWVQTKGPRFRSKQIT